VSTRVYVPATLGSLARFTAEGGVGPTPVHAHAVTAWLRAAWPDADQEEWEYAVLMAAADASLVLLTEEDLPRRVVIVAEAADLVEDPESTGLRIDSAIPMRAVHAVHADTVDIDPSLPERLGDLGWFGVQEIPDLLVDLE
jgi:hypothetical protein